MPEKIRKQCYELTPSDLSTWPAWEFALDEEGEPGQDEATVRPYTFSGALDPSNGMFIVAATFWLADGTIEHGFVTPAPAGGDNFGRIQPQIVTKRGQVGFWLGVGKPDPKRAYATLGRDAASVFPIRFESTVPLVGFKVTGTLHGFLCLEGDFNTVRTIQ
jgi:hypothetical protein